MELRFGPQGENRRTPPALARFGRARGIALGGEDRCAVTPPEARQLFLAATPMPQDLRSRVETYMDRGLMSPERVCYTLLSQIWSPIELDYLLATSSRTPTILSGGSPFQDRRARLCELETARAAFMIGMFFRRLAGGDGGASKQQVAVIEDDRDNVEWRIDADQGLVEYSGASFEAVPWLVANTQETERQPGPLRVLARGLPLPHDVDVVQNSSGGEHGLTVLLVPSDISAMLPADVPRLVCPLRLQEIDQEIAAKFERCRVGRS